MKYSTLRKLNFYQQKLLGMMSFFLEIDNCACYSARHKEKSFCSLITLVCSWYVVIYKKIFHIFQAPLFLSLQYLFNLIIQKAVRWQYIHFSNYFVYRIHHGTAHVVCVCWPKCIFLIILYWWNGLSLFITIYTIWKRCVCTYIELSMPLYHTHLIKI